MNNNESHQMPPTEPLTRFCPGCGSIGPVEDKYRDCCPDGNTARFVPVPFAKHCKGLFDLALQNVATPPVAEPLCPRPINSKPDNTTMAECILAGECGCTVKGHEYAQRKAAEDEAKRLRDENLEAKSIINELRVLIENSLPVDRSAPIWEMVKEFQRKTK